MRLLTTALLLGITGDLLLRAMPAGINVPLWTILFLAGFAYIVRDARAMVTGTIGSLVASCGLAWRTSHTLVALDFVLLLFFLALLSLRARGVREWAAGVTTVAFGLLASVAFSIAGVIQVFFTDRPWRTLQPGRLTRRALVVIRGFIIAFPLLLIFIALLTSADPAFASLLQQMFNVDFPRVFSHLALTIFITLPVAGFLRSTLNGTELPDLKRPSMLYLGAAETNVAIALIDILFAAFVAVQIRYFFGGAALVKVAPKLTYAEYARHGFFELVAVAAIVLPLLLIAEWLIVKTNMATFRLLALVQVLLVFVILISAYRRMQLYVDEFGLTELRLYTTAFMFLVAALLAWFCISVLAGHRERFFIGAVASGLAVVIVLHAINPDALIVRTNFAHRHSLDVPYLKTLSEDAVPAFAAAMPDQACVGRTFATDWRSWNASRRAAAAVCTRSR